MTLDDLKEIIEVNIPQLREALRKKAQKTLPKIPPMGEIVTGNIFIESVGSIVDFDQYGNFEFLYTPETLPLRNPGLSESEKAREKVFNDIAKQIPPGTIILNIGAGGDTIIPNCLERSGHQVISTDFAQNTVNKLKNYINSYTFACDLYYIDSVLPKNSIDFILGNSTLGYIDPKKLKKIILNISNIMKFGAVFTFDLAPHPMYFIALEQKEYQTVINESDIDPTKLIEFIEKYGVQNGINSMSFYHYYRANYTNIAVIFLIKEIFENEGFKCTVGTQNLVNTNGSKKTQLSLRVSKNFPAILNFIEDENEITIPSSVSEESNDKKIWYRLALIDRKNAAILARKFSIYTTPKENPWNVARYINNNLSPEKLPIEITRDVLKNIHPLNIMDKIRPFIYGKDIQTPKPLPIEIALDQNLHKMVIDGTSNMSMQEADIEIDSIYLRSQKKQLLKQKQITDIKQQKASKAKRKQAKNSRKKNKK